LLRVLVLASVVSISVSLCMAHDNPVIGILTQPITDGSKQHYLAASYVKYIESAGARVVPIFFDATTAELDILFAGMNGMVYTGGGSSFQPGTQYYKTGHYLYQKAIAAQKAGDYFPLWGTCLGFEFLSCLTAEDFSILHSGFDSHNLPIPLNMTSLAQSSRMLGGFPSNIFNALATQPITMNNHQAGVFPSVFRSNSKLSAFYNVLSTNRDRKGIEFVSTIEAKSAPVYATQWHPEKNAFEWTPNENLPHTASAVRAAQYVANFFVDEARKNNHTFSSSVLTPRLIYNWSPVFTGAKGSDFTQEYIWG